MTVVVAVLALIGSGTVPMSPAEKPVAVIDYGQYQTPIPGHVWTDTALTLTVEGPPPTTAQIVVEPVPEPRAVYIGGLTDAQLYRLRMCESTNDYGAWKVWGTNYASRSMGGYQFEQDTWNGIAERHMPWLVGVKPYNASPPEQDEMARHLFNERGRAPWPTCGRNI